LWRAAPYGNLIRCCRYLREERLVPSLEDESVGTFDIPENKRLVWAIEEEEAGVDILHDVGPKPQKRGRISL
jgi:hypothetical protein